MKYFLLLFIWACPRCGNQEHKSTPLPQRGRAVRCSPRSCLAAGCRFHPSRDRRPVERNGGGAIAVLRDTYEYPFGRLTLNCRLFQKHAQSGFFGVVMTLPLS